MFLITAVVKTTGLTLQYYIDGTEGEPFDAEIELTDEEFGQLVQLIIEYKEQEFYTEDEHIEGGIFTEEFLCDKAPELHEKLADFAGAGATVPLTGFGHLLAKGVREAVDEQGFLGIFTGKSS